MINLAERVRRHKLRKYDCVNYCNTKELDKQCAIIIGTPPNIKAYYSECEFDKGGCAFYRKGK